MSHIVTIMGAGGAMGRRITRGLQAYGDAYQLRFVEVSENGRRLMAEEFGTVASEQVEALEGARTVVLATPDRLVGRIAQELVPMLDPGTNLLSLDPAAAHAGRIPERADVNVFACHPSHPPLYDLLVEPDPDARTDYWGNGRAHQALVIAQAWGDESEYDSVQKVAEDMFAPISRTHRITVEQMAYLEPAMSESVTNSCLDLMRQTRDHIIASGVPAPAVQDFFMGHLQIGIALIFEQLDWKMSAGAALAMQDAHEVLFKEDWKRILDPEAVLASTRAITCDGPDLTV